jgi:DNA-binding transcriptional LysR family regulator
MEKIIAAPPQYNASLKHVISAGGASMNSVEADQTEAFLAVIESGSFSAAGRKIGRDGSVVSRRIAALETRLGIRLLERSTRRVTPTEAGVRFRDRLREALEMVRAAENEARAMAALPAGLLRISLPLAFGRMWVAPRLPEFLARYPALRVQASYTDKYVDLVADGFDAAIRLGEMRDSRLIGRRIAMTHRLICAAPSYLSQRPALKEPDDLQRHDCVCFTPLATHPVWNLHRNGKKRAVRITGRLETDDAEAVVRAALAGTGIIMATDWLVARELAAAQLVPVLPEWSVSGEAGVSVVRASVRHQPAKTRAFVEWIAEVFATPPWQQQV